MKYILEFKIGNVDASLELVFNNTRQWAFHVNPTAELNAPQDWEKITATRVLLAAAVFGASNDAAAVFGASHDYATITYFIQPRDADAFLFGTESADEAAVALAAYVCTLIAHEYEPEVTEDAVAEAKADAENACAHADWSVFHTLMKDGYPYHEDFMNGVYNFANMASVWIAPGKF